ncbi:MAG: molybdopterin-guanine dinucleotide biosynthesis protein B [Methylobacter sp.]|nr:molybdopterin-guanine dinucleotide biosynthesis protein B [Methylobacter sp.]
MKNAKIPVLGFVAASGTGKTTLLTQLIPLLKQMGLRIGLIKHSHHDFEIDQPGKDSYRLREAGATSVMLVSQYRRAIINELALDKELRLVDQLTHLNQAELDLILVEGFRSEIFPKIEIYRKLLDAPLLYPDDSDIIAIATDDPLQTPFHLTQLNLNEPQMIATFIQKFISDSHD